MNGSKDLDRLHIEWGHEKFLLSSPFYLTRKRLITQMTEEMNFSRPNVLDVGCGIGDLLSTPLSKGFQCYGADLSTHVLRIARSNVRNADLVQADARFLPFRSNSFGLILCSEVLEHIHREDQVVNEIHRVLERNGIAIVTVPQGEQHWTEEDRREGHLRRYSRMHLARIFESTGFEIENLICWGFPMAVILRKLIYRPVFEWKLHKRMTRKLTIESTGLLLRFIDVFFRIDTLFKNLPLGLGLILKARKVL